MNVIPVINCPDLACAKEKIETTKTFLPAGSFLHMDVTDGIFAAHLTLNDPLQWAQLGAPFALEAHLMMEHPEEHLDAWLAAGMKRCIVHMETIAPHACRELIDRCQVAGATLMLSSHPDTPVDALTPYLALPCGFQVLAVYPGAAGQPFIPEVLDKIRFLREKVHDAIIEVDGGMTPETAALVKAAGADTIVSASYIFGSNDPKAAYETLKRI